MAPPETAPARVFKVPNAVFVVSLVPVAFLAMSLSLSLAVKVFYGYGLDDGLGALLRVLLPLSVPGAAMGLLKLVGRLEPVDSLPNPRDPGPPPPSTLALPDADAESLPMRPERLPVPAKRMALDGVLAWGGAAATAAAVLLAAVQQDSFDSVFGLKLGGVWWHGGYWNRWWFVFFALLLPGLGALAAGLLGFTRRLNRRVD